MASVAAAFSDSAFAVASEIRSLNAFCCAIISVTKLTSSSVTSAPRLPRIFPISLCCLPLCCCAIITANSGSTPIDTS